MTYVLTFLFKCRRLAILEINHAMVWWIIMLNFNRFRFSTRIYYITERILIHCPCACTHQIRIQNAFETIHPDKSKRYIVRASFILFSLDIYIQNKSIFIQASLVHHSFIVCTM